MEIFGAVEEYPFFFRSTHPVRSDEKMQDILVDSSPREVRSSSSSLLFLLQLCHNQH